jgi:hypothetical protein
MCFGGGGGSNRLAAANNAAAEANLKMAQQQRQDELDRQNRVNQSIGNINSAFGQFDNNYFNQKGQDYLGVYQPQVDRQYKEAQSDTLYQLARQGITNSSAGAKAFGDLYRDYGQQNLSLQSKANDYMNQARQQVEAQRNSLINQATATANPSAAASEAANSVGSLQMVQPTGGYSPLSGLFNTFTGALANTAGNAIYGNTSGGLLGSLFNGNKGSSPSQRIVKSGG